MIQTDESSIQYNGNNSTVTPYPVPFYFPDNSTIRVTVIDATGVEDNQVLGSDFTLTGVGNPDGGSLKTTWAVPVSSTVSIFRVVPYTQETSYEEGDSFPAKSHERALDKLTMEIQQVARGMGNGSGGATDLGTAFRLSDASSGINAVAKINDAMLGVDALGNAILRPASDMLGWLGQVGTVWADTAARLNTRGAFPGQLGVQLDNRTIYIAGSTTSGDWLPFLIGTGIVAATNGVPHLMTPPDGDLVGTDEAQTLYNKTLESPTIHTPTGLTKADVGLSQVDNTSDLNKPLSAATGAALAFKQDKSEKAISNGYASLDGGGKIPLAQIPDAVLGASQYKGTWNASTNSPSITTGSAPGKTGWYYSVAVAGTTTVDGISSWAVGDQIISNGTVWQKIVNVSAVSSVNTKTGAVVLVPSDLGLGNVDNTSDATKNSAAVTLTNKTINGANNTLSVRLDADVANSLPVNRLNNGTGAGPGTFWCGDNSWKTPSGTGDVNGPSGAGDGEVALYSGTTGKLIRRYSGTAGFGKFSATGGLSTSALIHGADLSPDVITSQPAGTASSNNRILIHDEASGQLRYAYLKSPMNYLAGLTLANNVSDAANDIDIKAGICRSDDDAADIELASLLTKRLDAAWVAGTNQGGRDTGVISDVTWHLFAIRNPTTNVSDALFSQSISAPTMPGGYTQKRRIGSVIRKAGVIVSFRQRGDYFQIAAPILDLNDGVPTPATNTNVALPNVPVGLKFLTTLSCRAYATGGSGAFWIFDPDVGPSQAYNLWSPSANNSGNAELQIWSNASSQVCISFALGTGAGHFFLSVIGYKDYRGKQD